MKEMFGAGTACVVCPVNKILFMEKEFHIPTMDTGGLIAKRFYKELTDIQVRLYWSALPFTIYYSCHSFANKSRSSKIIE